MKKKATKSRPRNTSPRRPTPAQLELVHGGTELAKNEHDTYMNIIKNLKA